MSNFDLNEIPEEEKDMPSHPEEAGNPEEQGVEMEQDRNELPPPEMMPLSESLLEIIFIFTAIYFPIILRGRE